MNTIPSKNLNSRTYEMLEDVDSIEVPVFDPTKPSNAKSKSMDNSTIEGKKKATDAIDVYKNSTAQDKDANFLAKMYASFTNSNEMKDSDINIAAKRNGKYRNDYKTNSNGVGISGAFKTQIGKLRNSCTTLNWKSLSGTSAEKGALYISTRLSELGYFGLDGKVITPTNNLKSKDLQFAIWIFQWCCSSYSAEARPIYGLKDNQYLHDGIAGPATMLALAKGVPCAFNPTNMVRIKEYIDNSKVKLDVLSTDVSGGTIKGNTEVRTEKPATTTETSGKPATTTETSGKPATTTETSGKPATTTETSGKPATTTETSGKPATTTETSGKPATTTETSGKPATTTETSGKPATTTETSGKPATTTETSGKPATTTETSGKPATTTETSGKPATTTETSGKPATTTETSGKPATTTETSGKPATTTETSGKPATTTETSGKPATTTETSGKPATTTETSGKPATTTETSGKPNYNKAEKDIILAQITDPVTKFQFTQSLEQKNPLAIAQMNAYKKKHTKKITEIKKRTELEVHKKNPDLFEFKPSEASKQIAFSLGDGNNRDIMERYRGPVFEKLLKGFDLVVEGNYNVRGEDKAQQIALAFLNKLMTSYKEYGIANRPLSTPGQNPNQLTIILADGTTITPKITYKQGDARLPLGEGKENIKVTALKDGKSEEIKMSETKLPEFTPDIEYIEDERVTFPGCGFDVSSYNLSPEFKTELNKMAVYLKKRPEKKIEIAGREFHRNNPAMYGYSQGVGEDGVRAVQAAGHNLSYEDHKTLNVGFCDCVSFKGIKVPYAFNDEVFELPFNRHLSNEDIQTYRNKSVKELGSQGWNTIQDPSADESDQYYYRHKSRSYILANLRAEETKAYLIELGINAERMITKSDPTYFDEGKKVNNRGVSIKIIKDR